MIRRIEWRVVRELRLNDSPVSEFSITTFRKLMCSTLVFLVFGLSFCIHLFPVQFHDILCNIHYMNITRGVHRYTSAKKELFKLYCK